MKKIITIAAAAALTFTACGGSDPAAGSVGIEEQEDVFDLDSLRIACAVTLQVFEGIAEWKANVESRAITGGDGWLSLDIDGDETFASATMACFAQHFDISFPLLERMVSVRSIDGIQFEELDSGLTAQWQFDSETWNLTVYE